MAGYLYCINNNEILDEKQHVQENVSFMKTVNWFRKNKLSEGNLEKRNWFLHAVIHHMYKLWFIDLQPDG